ncbi:lysosomal membrane ascorbate-dependent ferrireductase CYB561A3 isoform X1 [Rissa tridactyla]|uniref:lysosomal membrane ascorbate-dependent ferrireductase CYB561A3 isoform X1 n=2 Tax=Rissa tridactyla TaxID=75485 RepID=UPI0023BA74B3|nr:lysosomal membrane ascorbate-dependent ferrireductase CYB561A3 isoform X1 [Rissa tridactyla]
MEAAGEAEGAAGPGGRRAGLRHRRPVAEMLDLPFLPFCAFLGGLGFVCVAFVSAWCQHWRGGFAWDGSAQMFNWHPVLMVTGMVVLYGAAALVYRLPPAWRGPKFPWKVLHGALALAAFVLAVLGLVAVFRFHNDNGTPNMYSLHSWLGLATVLLFSCQWVAGFSAFLLPWAPTWLRALYKPIHVFFGSIILLLSVASCVSGINEKLFFSLMGRRRTSSCLLRLFLPTLWVSSSSSLGCWSWAPCPGRAGSALTPTPRTLASPCSPPSADACRGLSLPSRDCQPRALHPHRSPACSASPAFGLSPCPHRGLHLPVSDAHLPAGGTGTASLTAETCCGEDISLPLSWPGVGFLPATG